jgi:xylulose-5-phosphate/fructose-6-phosphate phosphoketolase
VTFFSILTCVSNSGFGYQVRIVENLEDIHNDLAASMEWALAEIHKIQHAARSGNPIVKPRWPMLVLRTPKGWTGPKTLHGEFIEGSFRSHQVPLPAAKTDSEELELLERWLESYVPRELFDAVGQPISEVLGVVPDNDEKKLGMRAEAYKSYHPISTPDWTRYAVKYGHQASCMKAIGVFLKDVLEA